MSVAFDSLSLIVAYLLGSIPFGYLLVKYVFTDHQDVRAFGSGATGATNVSRVAGLKGGGLTYLCDVAKGVLAVMIAGWISRADLWWMGAAGVLAILGHIFPIWIGFRGGKGVAAGAGVFFLLSPLSVLSSLLLWGVVFYWKRYVALASIIATAAVPLWVLLWEGEVFSRSNEELTALLVVTMTGCSAVIAAHHENIKRLIQGRENKISQDREPVTGRDV